MYEEGAPNGYLHGDLPGASFSKNRKLSSDLKLGKDSDYQVISELKSVSRFKILREPGPW